MKEAEVSLLLIVLVLVGIVELVIRCTAFLVFLVLTLFIIGLVMLDKRSMEVQTFLTPTCLVIAADVARRK